MNGLFLSAASAFMATVASIVLPLVVIMYIGVFVWHEIEKRIKK